MFAKSGMSAKLGRVHMLRVPCYVVSHLATVEPSSVVHGRWLLHWFRKNSPTSLIANEAYPSIRISEIEALRVEIPEFQAQLRIATVLDKVDGLRHKRQEAIRLADEFLRAVFTEIFGELTVNPYRWPVVPLGELIVNGPRNGLYCPSDMYGSGTPILRIDGFYDGEIVKDYKFKRVRIDESTATRFRLMDDSVVLNRVNSREFVGKAAYVPTLDEVTVFESNMMNFSVDRNRIDTYFLVRQLQSGFIRSQIARARKDAVNQSSINQEDVKGLQILVPPIAVQKQFRKISERLTPLRHRLELSKSLLVKAQKSLSHSMFFSAHSREFPKP